MNTKFKKNGTKTRNQYVEHYKGTYPRSFRRKLFCRLNSLELTSKKKEKSF